MSKNVSSSTIIGNAEFVEKKSLLEEYIKTIDVLYLQRNQANARKNVDLPDKWPAIEEEIKNVQKEIDSMSIKRHALHKELASNVKHKPGSVNISMLFRKDY